MCIRDRVAVFHSIPIWIVVILLQYVSREENWREIEISKTDMVATVRHRAVILVFIDNKLGIILVLWLKRPYAALFNRLGWYNLETKYSRKRAVAQYTVCRISLVRMERLVNAQL